MKIKIQVCKGYCVDSYAWICPLCGFSVFPDLLAKHVKKEAKQHLLQGHQVTKDIKIKFKFKVV